MIGFSVMMWFLSSCLIFLSISLLKGNDSWVHGKVLETAGDREGYAKTLGKPVLLVGVGIFLSGVLAVILQTDFAVLIAAGFLVLIAVISGIWLYKIQKRFS